VSHGGIHDQLRARNEIGQHGLHLAWDERVVIERMAVSVFPTAFGPSNAMAGSPASSSSISLSTMRGW
jgi:hypothetical protein